VSSAPFGAILAGGESRRFGAPKALATVGGVRIVDRVREALAGVVPDLILIANDAALFAPLALPLRADARPGLGALGGIYTALLWAREAGRAGALAVACDMPFLAPPLLARLLAERVGADVVAPESGGRRGIEPLAAYYATGCIPAIERALERGERQIVGFHGEVRVKRIPLEEVRAYGEPELLFLNVNTPAEHERAERIAAARGAEADHG
jgi:molybdopterin-guanine dinucleotide biosynthesis protein B/molybdopterin-guanine dinucleotide biosynthesis protein